MIVFNETILKCELKDDAELNKYINKYWGATHKDFIYNMTLEKVLHKITKKEPLDIVINWDDDTVIKLQFEIIDIKLDNDFNKITYIVDCKVKYKTIDQTDIWALAYANLI